MNVPTNTLRFTDLPFDHPNEEILLRVKPYSRYREPVVVRDPPNASEAIVCFETTHEAQLAATSLGITSYGQVCFLN